MDGYFISQKIERIISEIKGNCENRQKDTACERLNLLDKRQLPR